MSAIPVLVWPSGRARAIGDGAPSRRLTLDSEVRTMLRSAKGMGLADGQGYANATATCARALTPTCTLGRGALRSVTLRLPPPARLWRERLREMNPIVFALRQPAPRWRLSRNPSWGVHRRAADEDLYGHGPGPQHPPPPELTPEQREVLQRRLDEVRSQR